MDMDECSSFTESSFIFFKLVIWLTIFEVFGLRFLLMGVFILGKCVRNNLQIFLAFFGSLHLFKFIPG